MKIRSTKTTKINKRAFKGRHRGLLCGGEYTTCENVFHLNLKKAN